MAPNTAFLIARRRNEQRRSACNFFSQLTRCTGLSADQAPLLDPAHSVELEAMVYSSLQQGLATGSVTRHCHLPLPEAITIVRKSLGALGNVSVHVILCRTPDFAFRCSAPVALHAAQSLIEFDGDTVTIVAEDNSAGVVIDAETENQGQMLYEVDQWGRFSTPTRPDSIGGTGASG